MSTTFGASAGPATLFVYRSELPCVQLWKFFVYLIESKATRSTHAGAVHDGDVLRRLAQHNGAIHGGVERLTAARPWRLVVWVKRLRGNSPRSEVRDRVAGGVARTGLTTCANNVRRECPGEVACIVVPAACGTVVSAPLALVLCRSCARDRTARKRELACVDECGASAGRRSARMILSVCRR